MKVSIILAAGKGTRMKSDLPKTLHKICGKAMINYVIDATTQSGIEKNILILGHGINLMQNHLQNNFQNQQLIFAEQPMQESSPYGTGFAAMCALDHVEDEDFVVVLCGDGPLLKSTTLETFMNYHAENNFDVSVMTAILDRPTGYGRIVRDQDNKISAIVEEKEATEDIKKIQEINTGIYCFKGKSLKAGLAQLKINNPIHEWYLTDTIEILKNQKAAVGTWLLTDSEEIKAVNDLVQLAEVNAIMQKRINQKLMLNGVKIISPENTFIEHEVEIENGTKILPGTILENKTKIGKNCTIGPNAYLSNSQIGDEVIIDYSKVIDSEIQNNSSIGPFAFLRANTKIGKNVRIGDFVEIKNSTIADNSTAAHHGYIGDAEIGKEVNIGCGVVFANYDGKNKHQTKVGDRAFIGSNSNLVAPISIAKGAYIACGSTITADVAEGDLAIARARQVNKSGQGKNRY